MRRSTRTPSLLVLASIAASCAASTGMARADECVAKPNAPAPQGQHWYHRIDRNLKRQCWYLAQRPAAQRGATQRFVHATSETPTTSPGAPQASTAEPAGAPAGVAAPSSWPEGTRFLDEPPSLQPAPQTPLADPPRPAAAIDAAPTRVSNCGDTQQSPANARPSSAASATLVAGGGHAFALIMLGTVLLTITGPVIHATRRRRRRVAGDRQDLGPVSPSISSTSASGAPAARDRNSETAPPSVRERKEDLTETVQRLIDVMQTSPNAGDSSKRVGQSA